MAHGDTWVVVPAYDEATQISRVVADLRAVFGHVLVVDDGSTDDTGTLAAVAGATVLRHPVNLGQGAALQTAFDHVAAADGARWLVTFDADGQHRVADALAMLDLARTSDLDVVLASRFTGTTIQMPRLRRLVLRAATRYTRASTGLAVTDAHNGLRVLNVRVLDRVRLRQPRMAYASELTSAIATHGLTWREVPTTVVYSEYSRGKGQRNLNAVNILFDLVAERIRPAS